MLAGFVNIFGEPNAGKSTLFNALLGNKLSIITRKAQTTRNRIKGFINKKNEYQIVLSDTPGILDPAYKLQQKMMDVVKNAYEDTDVGIILFDCKQPLSALDTIMESIQIKAPLILVINKIDLINQQNLQKMIEQVTATNKFQSIVPVSALKKINIDNILNEILKYLPESPAYFNDDEDNLSDLPMRFFISEIIREKIMELYEEEVPYHTNVSINEYKDKGNIIKIQADINVQRESQKIIIIGKNGLKIKQVGVLARKDIEEFVDNKVYLELFVKVNEKWRDNENVLSKIIF